MALQLNGSGTITGLAEGGIEDAKIIEADIKDKAVAVSKLKDGTDGELITWNASGVAETVAVGASGHYLKSNGDGAKPSFAAVSSPLSFRNLIINGACMVAQRGTTQATHTAAGYFTVDRFLTSIDGEDEGRTEDQITLTSSDTGPWAKGFTKAFQITNGDQSSAVGTDDYQYIVYKVEGQDLANSGWHATSTSSYITLSFWVKSSVAQTFYGYVRSRGGTNKYYSFNTGSLSANTWTKVTKTIPGHADITINNDTNDGFQLVLYQFAGTTYTDVISENTWLTWSSGAGTVDQTSTWWETDNATFAITGLQLEVGDTATEFEHRSYADELLRCQRYYLVWADAPNAGEDEPIGSAWYNGDSYSFLTDCRFPVEMRDHPSVVSKNATNAFRVYGAGVGGAHFDQINFTEQITTRIARVGGSSVSLDTDNAGVGMRAMASGGGYLHFNAEL